MKQFNSAHQEAYQELLTVTNWTIQMLDQNAVTYSANSLNPHSYNQFCNWAAAVRVAVAKAETVEDSVQQIKKTHADVELPSLSRRS